MKQFFVLLMLFALGCTSYTVIDGKEDTEGGPLDTNASAYVSLPEDFESGGYHYGGSGQETASQLLVLFLKYLREVETGEHVEDLDQALQTANEKGFTYLIFPKIVVWEDYAGTNLTGRDRLVLHVKIIDVSTRNTLDRFIVYGTGRWLTFGGFHPLDISTKPMKQWVDSLF